MARLPRGHEVLEKAQKLLGFTVSETWKPSRNHQIHFILALDN